MSFKKTQNQIRMKILKIGKFFIFASLLAKWHSVNLGSCVNQSCVFLKKFLSCFVLWWDLKNVLKRKNKFFVLSPSYADFWPLFKIEPFLASFICFHLFNKEAAWMFFKKCRRLVLRILFQTLIVNKLKMVRPSHRS